jgi:hypothetical protein
VNRYLPAIIVACLGAAMWPAAIFAAPLADEVLTCAAETDSARRLSCYDQVVVELKKKGTASAPARPGTRSESDAEFGFQESPLARKRQLVGPKEITAMVSKIQHRADGELVVALDNGQVWRQIEPVAYFPLEVGDKVQISAGALASYFLAAPSKRATRVTRIQ